MLLLQKLSHFFWSGPEAPSFRNNSLLEAFRKGTLLMAFVLSAAMVVELVYIPVTIAIINYVAMSWLEYSVHAEAWFRLDRKRFT